MKNKMEMIQQSIKEAKLFAKQHNVKLHIYEDNLIDDVHLCAKDYPNDTELMTMQYKGYLVNVYIGSYQSFDEINDKWIDYDIYTDISCEERINDDDDIRGQNVLVAITDIQFYIDKIEEDIKKKGEIIMIKFTTINVDGLEVTREFKTVKELTQEYYSDNCDLPANDDKIVYAEFDGLQLHYPQFFEELIEELGIKEKKNMKTRFYVCGIGYDENNCVTDYEKEFGDFNTYEEAYETFVKLQCKDENEFFTNTKDICKLLIQLEECEETENNIECIDVKNEWWITKTMEEN